MDTGFLRINKLGLYNTEKKKKKKTAIVIFVYCNKKYIDLNSSILKKKNYNFWNVKDDFVEKYLCSQFIFTHSIIL